jgi:hypothetical protein
MGYSSRYSSNLDHLSDKIVLRASLSIERMNILFVRDRFSPYQRMSTNSYNGFQYMIYDRVLVVIHRRVCRLDYDLRDSTG